jgi:hypothetical protein
MLKSYGMLHSYVAILIVDDDLTSESLWVDTSIHSWKQTA